MCAAERWTKHTKRLPPLRVGDFVRIQNQAGPHPLKWDKTGTVIEVRQFDQYIVKVDGSGRVTLRNRKFLRKYLPVYMPVSKGTLPNVGGITPPHTDQPIFPITPTAHVPHGQTSGSNTDITSAPQTPMCDMQPPTPVDVTALSANSTPDQQQMPAGTNCDPPSGSIRNDPDGGSQFVPAGIC